MEISQDIGARRAAITSAVVALVSPTLVCSANLNEALLNRFGCSCCVDQRDGLAALLDLLVDARIVTATPCASSAIDARIGVYLRGQGGQTSRLVFDGAGRRGTCDGALGLTVGNERFAPQLRAWAAQHTKKKGLEIAL